MPSDKNLSIFRHLNLPSGPILAAEKKTRFPQNLHSTYKEVSYMVAKMTKKDANLQSLNICMNIFLFHIRSV